MHACRFEMSLFCEAVHCKLERREGIPWRDFRQFAHVSLPYTEYILFLKKKSLSDLRRRKNEKEAEAGGFPSHRTIMEKKREKRMEQWGNLGVALITQSH